MRGTCFVRKGIELSDSSVPLDGGIEPFRVKGVEPCAKPRELTRVELLDGLFDVFGGGHSGRIAFSREP